jgi:hypothetical protein
LYMENSYWVFAVIPFCFCTCFWSPFAVVDVLLTIIQLCIDIYVENHFV